MLRLLFRLCIVKEIPAERRSHRIELLSLVIELHFLFVELLGIVVSQFFLVVNSLLHVYVDDIANFFLALPSFLTLESFQ